VNDIRLTDVIDATGVASALDMRFAAADVAELTVGYNLVNDQFRQLEGNPSYITDQALRIGALFNLDRFLPESFGISMPLQMSYAKTDADPFYLADTDLRADALRDLREPGSSVTGFDVALRRTRRGTSFLERAVLDPLVVRASRATGTNVTSLSEAKTTNRQVHGDYGSTPRARTIRSVPDFVASFVNTLPGFIRNSEFGRALQTSRLRWNPARLRLTSTLTNNRTDRTVFRVPVERPGDSLLPQLPSIMHLWRNAAELDLRPFSTFGIRAGIQSTRDLQDYGDDTPLGRFLREQSSDLLGMDIGFERTRRITTGLDITPVINAWLRPRFIFTSSFLFSRDPNAPGPEPDSALVLFRTPQSTSNSRVRELGATIDLANLFAGLFGDSSAVTRAMGGLFPADVSLTRELRSNFNDIAFEPDLRYELALGSLNDFRVQNGVLAVSTGEVGGLAISAGTRLPLGAQVRINYRTSRNTLWLRRAEGQERNEQESLEWPSLTASWVYTPTTGFRRLVSSVNAQVQYRTVVRTTYQPLFDPVADAGIDPPVDVQRPRMTEDYTQAVTPSLTIIWPAGVSTSGRFSSARNQRFTSGNTTNTDQVDWNASLGFGFRPPVRLARTRNEMRTTVSFTSSKRAVCLVSSGDTECRVVSDSRRQLFDVRLDTGLSDTLRGGATFSYVLNELRQSSTRTSQIVFTIYLDYTFFAGEIR
jgi:hypothetical protein